MRKERVALFLIPLFLGISGCGRADENVIEEPQWETVDESDPYEDAAGENGAGLAEGEGKSANEDGKSAAGTEGDADLGPGLIENQSFETELDGWGKVFFAAAAPSKDGEPPHFMLLKDKEVVYTFPETPKSTEDKFVEVSAVAFQDFNKDGKKDVLVLVTYSDGQSSWKEPGIFLQENSDNMFYLDHPDLESYRVFQDLESDQAEEMAGAAFYRDTFLEEYLSRQGLTESIAALAESWVDYVDYVDSLSGSFGTEQQIALFAKSRDAWAETMDYANDINRFTIAGMGYDGKLTLIVSNQGGTGNYTYSRFYQINEKGELEELETSFREGDSQPDIIMDQMTVYSSFSNHGNRNYFVVYDMLKDSPASYINRISSLSLTDGFVLETPLASQTILYEGEEHSARIVSEDCNGNPLTEEEYDHFADTYYSNMGLTKQTAFFKWLDISSLEGVSDEEVGALLQQAYDGFSVN